MKDSKGFYHDFGSDIDNLQKVEGNIYYNDGRKWSAPTGPKSGCRGNRCSANGRSYFSSTQQDYNNNRISRNEYYKNKVIMLNKDSVSYTG